MHVRHIVNHRDAATAFDTRQLGSALEDALRQAASGSARCARGVLGVLLALAWLSCGTTEPSDIALTTPFVDSADIAAVYNGFSTTASAPWGFVHNGIDFTPSADLTPFQAAASGKVQDVTLQQNSQTSNWQVNIRIKLNSTYTLEYVFEPFSTQSADGQAQRASISVSAGQSVSAGDVVGRLHMVGSGAHVHFGLVQSGDAICPEPYFTAEARAAVLDLIHKTNPTWNMCY